MATREYLEVYEGLKKREQARHPEQWDLCPSTGERLENVVLIVAPPDYPQLADGLEIGAVYEYEWENLSLYLISERSSDGYFFEWCEKLVEFTTGSRLEGDKRPLIQWSNDLSDLVVDKQKYPETDGRGPFWALLRYSLRGMMFDLAPVPRIP